MATFCLIHGSAQGPSGWDLLVPELRKRGHDVLLADLPAGVNQLPWDAYSESILMTCALARDLVLVGTSMSCIFLPLAAQSERVSRMVLVAGMIAPPGIAPMQMVRQEMQEMFNPAWVGKDPTRDPDAAREFLFHDCSPDVQDWALGTLRLMVPQKVLNEPPPIQTLLVKPAVYVVCREDRTIRPEWSRRKARELLGVEPLELAGGHCPHVSRPAELAEILHRVV